MPYFCAGTGYADSSRLSMPDIDEIDRKILFTYANPVNRS